ncbi:hypothetical protein YC2023_038973 [Brassica napus]
MADLPKDLVEEVFSRLPVTSLRGARSTCKNWNTLTKDESFFKNHIVEQASTELTVVMVIEFRVYLMSLILHDRPSITCQGKLSSLDNSDRVDISLVCHCDGLLLCIAKDFASFVVWNPYMGQTLWLKPRSPHPRLDWYPAKPAVGEPFKVADFLICFDFTTERFGPRLSLPFHTGFECTVSLSSVREEQLAVLLQVDYLLRMEIWVTTKIEPEEVSWNKLFFAVNMEPFLDFQFGMSQGSFFLDQEKRVVVVFDKDTDMCFTRNIYSLCHWRGWIFQTNISEEANVIAMNLNKKSEAHSVSGWWSTRIRPDVEQIL